MYCIYERLCAAVVVCKKCRCTHRDTSSVGFAASFSSRRSHIGSHCVAMLPPCLPQEGISCPEGVFHAAARQYFMPTNGRYFIPREAGISPRPKAGFLFSQVGCPEEYAYKQTAADDIAQSYRQEVAQEEVADGDGTSGDGHCCRDEEHIGHAVFKAA